MCKRTKKSLMFIVYDGIKNSVFISQVLQPLLNRLDQDNNLEITLVSFEKKRPSNKVLMELIPAHDRLHFVLCRRLPFFGKLSLRIAIFQLKRLLKRFSFDKIITRGPLAGWVALRAARTIKELIVQARGLCAQEYRFICREKEKRLPRKSFCKFVFASLNNIEYQVYQSQNKKGLSFQVNIEAVSPALKEYLVVNYCADPDKISIAQKDLPKKIDKKEVKKWRGELRKKLGISEDNFVYCYAGSAKPWQCVPQIFDYFSDQHKKNPKSFLLLLSQDKEKIQNMLSQKDVPQESYTLLNAKPAELDRYLCASDVGLLFRDKDIINWVSRPTKMLEYQAVGLKIIHNNTVALLEN